MRIAACLAAVLFLGAAPAGTAAAGILDETRAGFAWRAELQGHGTAIDLVSSELNFGNPLGFARYAAGLDLRPELGLAVRRLDVSAAPRGELRWSRYEDGPRRGETETTDDWFIQSWRARLRVGGGLFLSYGREILQWGPSYLLSPSNPFNRGNGENNPRVEEPGMEFARAVWIPGRRVAVSALANMGQGRLETFREFSRRYAIKADWIGEGNYASVILSVCEEESDRVTRGAFAGWSLSDAVLLHAEGAAAETFGDGDLLLGGTYTFSSGAFLVVEAFHDGTGCRADRIEACFLSSSGGSDPADVLFRRNYLMFQLTHPRLRDRAQATARWIHGLDDGSTRVVGIYEREMGDRLEAFVTGLADLGSPRDEFGSVVAAAVMAGLAWTF